ncbi:hypothetical protein, partial [Hydrogenibacillus schlegelii]|uniref:hypothetical protein n=1 Tax=Hydrogenibacillus schlegelii TaxID=1484 RepID=UPI00235421B6
MESLDEGGRAALATVRSNVEGITDDDWEDILTVNGKNLQEFVDGKIGNGKSKEIIGNLIKIIYGTKEGLESDIRVYRINYAPYFDIIFGDEHAVDAFFAFLNESLREYEVRLRALLSGSFPKRYTSLDEVIRDAMRTAAEKTGLDQTLAKGLEIGVEDFLTIKERLDANIDPDRRGLQALVWGLARAGGVSISGPETVRAGQVGQYTLSFIDGKTVQSGASESSVGLEWKSSDPRLASFDPDSEGLLKAHSEGKVRIEAWLLGYKIAEKDVVVTVSRTGGGNEAEGDKQGKGREPLELKISEDTVTRALAENPGNESRFIRLELADVALKPGDTVKVTLSGHSLSKIQSAQKGLNITLSGLGLVLPHDALPAFGDADGDFSLTVRVEEAKNTPVRIASAPTTEVVSFAYAIEGPGSLKRPIDVTLKLADGGTDVRKVGAYLKQADGSWKYIGGRADAAKKTLTAKMSRFGTVAAIAYHKTFADLQNHWAKDVVEVLAA